MNPRRILVTGLGGFLGSYVQSVVAREARFSQIELVDWRTVGGDLMHRSDYQKSVASENYDGVLHLAWLSTSASDYECDTRNAVWAGNTVALALACADVGVQFLGVGSGLEHDVTAVSTPYLEAKRLAYFEISQHLDESAFAWLRPFWIVSIPDGRPRVLSQALSAQADGVPFALRKPDQLLDFIEVRDVASGILTVILNEVAGPQDIGSGVLRSVGEMVSVALGGARPNRSKVESDVNPYEIANTQRLMSLGWQPSNTLALFGD